MKVDCSARENLTKLMLAYQPSCPEQIALCARMRSFIEEDADCLDRNNFYGHITASAWVVDPAGEKALLTLHRKIGLWLQLGGHAEGEADLLAVALQEVKEESGLDNLRPLVSGVFDLDVHRIPAVGKDPSHLHFDCRFLLQSQEQQPLMISEESIDLAWFRPEEILKLNTDASVLRLCRKWQDVCKNGGLCHCERSAANQKK